MKYLILLAPIILFSTSVSAANLKIKLENVRNNEGNIAIAIYNKEEDFKNNLAKGAIYTMLLSASGAKTITLHDVEAGTYAISVLHDENKNEKLDVNKRGFPTEGYAYSNNVGEMSIPSFEKASFVHSKEKETAQTIKMIYIK